FMAVPSFPWKNGKYLHARGGNFGEEDDEKGGRGLFVLVFYHHFFTRISQNKAEGCRVSGFCFFHTIFL
ncbi:hypothetical protein, partial [uncultured Bilophila sp.]|uniref:hypothetical protein n=2 Tax=uncultured Bilophila sp. TaxID=529385 RepID=UPI00263104EB